MRMPKGGSWLPLQDTEKLLTKGARKQLARSCLWEGPGGGKMGDDSSQGLHSLDPGSSTIFATP